MRHHLGRVVATAAVASAVPHDTLCALLDRHAAGDWGNLDSADKAANDEAARSGEGRLFSSYNTADHGTLWIITDDIRGEGEGPITTVFFFSRGLLRFRSAFLGKPRRRRQLCGTKPTAHHEHLPQQPPGAAADPIHGRPALQWSAAGRLAQPLPRGGA